MRRCISRASLFITSSRKRRGSVCGPVGECWGSAGVAGLLCSGGAAGIGGAIVEQFAHQGSRVAFVDKDTPGVSVGVGVNRW